MKINVGRAAEEVVELGGNELSFLSLSLAGADQKQQKTAGWPGGSLLLPLLPLPTSRRSLLLFSLLLLTLLGPEKKRKLNVEQHSNLERENPPSSLSTE